MFKIVPKDEKFFDQIEQLSALAKSSAELLGGLIQGFPKDDGFSDRLSKACSDAASVMHATQCRLDDAFITPLDREDIMQLITDLFDVIDKVTDAGQRFSLYGLKEMFPSLRLQCETLVKITTALDGLLRELRHEKKLKELSSQIDEVQALEKTSTENANKFLSDLFKGNPDPLEVMKKKELHDMLESAIWSCDDVTRTLGRVLLKNG